MAGCFTRAAQQEQAFAKLFVDIGIGFAARRMLLFQSLMDGERLVDPAERSKSAGNRPIGNIGFAFRSLLMEPNRGTLEHSQRIREVPTLVVRPADVVQQGAGPTLRAWQLRRFGDCERPLIP